MSHTKLSALQEIREKFKIDSNWPRHVKKIEERDAPHDAEMLKFISTFGTEKRSTGAWLDEIVSHYKAASVCLSKIIDEYNAFEDIIEPYYPDYEKPEEVKEFFSEASRIYHQRCIRRHEIFVRLYKEKIRRFGPLGFYYSHLPTGLSDDISIMAQILATIVKRWINSTAGDHSSDSPVNLE